MTVPEAQRMKHFESVNAKLKRLVAEQQLDILILKDIVTKKWRPREPKKHAAKPWRKTTAIVREKHVSLWGQTEPLYGMSARGPMKGF